MSKKEHTKHIIEIDNKPYRAVIEEGVIEHHYEVKRLGESVELPRAKEEILALINHLMEVLNCLEELTEKTQKIQELETAKELPKRSPRELPSAVKPVKTSGFLG